MFRYLTPLPFSNYILQTTATLLLILVLYHAPMLFLFVFTSRQSLPRSVGNFCLILEQGRLNGYQVLLTRELLRKSIYSWFMLDIRTKSLNFHVVPRFRYDSQHKKYYPFMSIRTRETSVDLECSLYVPSESESKYGSVLSWCHSGWFRIQQRNWNVASQS